MIIQNQKHQHNHGSDKKKKTLLSTVLGPIMRV